ncbi:MAG: 3D domain-containing protein [Kiritimatiellae bacterium]|nr:3D domain-containing protein [Kiritimatiellia bacterium]
MPIRERLGFTALLQRAAAVAAVAWAVAAFAFLEGCRTVFPSERDLRGWKRSVVRMEVTGYDSGPRSCNWKRNWYGRPVVASGPDKGKPKAVGITASGTRAKRGTAAADPKYYPFGTVLYVPGYGYATVEDTGGAIKGPGRLDLWFSTEREAFKWGRRKNLAVTVWKKP